MPMHSSNRDRGDGEKRHTAAAHLPDHSDLPSTENTADPSEQNHPSAALPVSATDTDLFRFARHLLNSHEQVSAAQAERLEQGQHEVGVAIRSAAARLATLGEMVSFDNGLPARLPAELVTDEAEKLLEIAAEYDIEIQQSLKSAFHSEEDQSLKSVIGVLRFELDVIGFLESDIGPALLKMPCTPEDTYDLHSDLVARLDHSAARLLLKELITTIGITPSSEKPLVHAFLRSQFPEFIHATLDQLDIYAAEQRIVGFQSSEGDSATLHDRTDSSARESRYEELIRGIELTRLETFAQSGLTCVSGEDLFSNYAGYADHSLKDLAAKCLILYDRENFAVSALNLARDVTEEYSDRLPALRHYAQAAGEAAIPVLTTFLDSSDTWMALQAARALSNPAITTEAGPLFIQNRISARIRVPNAEEQSQPLHELACLCQAARHDEAVADTLKAVFSAVEIPRERFDQLDGMTQMPLPPARPEFEYGPGRGTNLQQQGSFELLYSGVGFLQLLNWRAEALDSSDTSTGALGPSSAAALGCIVSGEGAPRLISNLHSALDQRLPVTAVEEVLLLLRRFADMQSVPIGAALAESNEIRQPASKKTVKNKGTIRKRKKRVQPKTERTEGNARKMKVRRRRDEA